MIESERSFLVRQMPDLAGAKSKKIYQHYLSDGPQPLRLRRTESADGTSCELTKKLDLSPADLSRKEEINVPLTADEHAMLLPLAKRGLSKTRWLIPLPSGLTAEVDVFDGALEGFVKAEVEFPDEAARAAFVPPPWFGREVTEEAWAKNSSLAATTFAAIRAHLE